MREKTFAALETQKFYRGRNIETAWHDGKWVLDEASASI